MSDRIKNWNKYQHYKSGKQSVKPHWIKLYHDLLDDIEWHELDPLAAKTLVSLWLLASENGGTLPALNIIAFRLRLPEKQIKSVLSRLPHWLDGSIDGVYTESIPEAYIPEEEEEEEIEGEEEGEENEKTISHEFEHQFWQAYPNRVGKKPALAAFIKVRKTHPLNAILSGLERYIRHKPAERQRLNPATFLNQERFDDVPAPPPLQLNGKRSATLEAADRLISKFVNEKVEQNELPDNVIELQANR